MSKAVTLTITGLKRLKNYFKLPAFFIIIFLITLWLSLIIKMSQLQLIILISALCSLGLIFFIFRIKTLSAIMLVGALGLVFSFIMVVSRSDLLPGCSTVRIVSKTVEIGSRVEFLVKNPSGQRAIIQSEPNNLYHNDEIKVCYDATQVASLEKSKQLFYLGRYQSDLVVSAFSIEKIKSGSGVLRLLYRLNDYLGDRLSQFLRGDSAVLGKGLILGGSGGFSKALKQDLQNSGTSHIVAVSGYNVSIITIVLFGALRSLFSRRVAITSTIVVIIIFCLLTGGTSSVLRASLMGIIYILAKVLGRRAVLLNAMFVAAFVMTIFNPYVIFDVGFQLSFLATLGLIVGSSLLSSSNQKNKKTFWFVILEIVITTVLAQVFTLPILLNTFGKVSLIAPIANLLILPIVPIAMLFVALTLALSFVPYLVVLLAELTNIILRYILFVISYFGSLEWSKVENLHFGLASIAIYYAVLITFFYFFALYKKEKFERTIQ